MRKRKSQRSKIEEWRTSLTPEEKRKMYLESIPDQVSASMAFEGEHVSLKMLKKYMKILKNIPRPHGT